MRKTLLAIAIGATLSGCASVGPDYQRPAVETPANWQIDIQQANDLANTAWWNQFQDPVLDHLIQTALRENKDVQIAAARVEEFLGRYGVTRSAQFPQVGANAAGARTRNSENARGLRWAKIRSTATRSIWARRLNWIYGASCAAPARRPAPTCWPARKPGAR